MTFVYDSGITHAQQANSQFVYDFVRARVEMADILGVRTNFTYDAGPRDPDADTPLVIVRTDFAEGQNQGRTAR